MLQILCGVMGLVSLAMGVKAVATGRIVLARERTTRDGELIAQKVLTGSRARKWGFVCIGLAVLLFAAVVLIPLYDR